MIQINHDILGLISIAEACYQPDANSHSDINLLEKAYATPIYAKATEIRNQYLTAQEDADIIVPFARTVTQTTMYAFEFVYTLREDTIYIYYGYYNGSSMAPYKDLIVQYDYPYTGEEYRKNLVFWGVRERINNDYSIKNLSEKFNLFCSINACYSKRGVWEDPSTAHPKGTMRYSYGDMVAITALPPGEVCINTSSEELKKQSTLIGYCTDDYGSINFSDADWNNLIPVDGTTPDNPVVPDPTEDDDEGRSDDDDTKGGGGGKDRTYDPIPIPPIPSVTAAGAGFFTLYRLEESDMSGFASEMFADNMWQKIKLFFSNPLDFIAGCHILPFRPAASTSYYPKFGEDYWDVPYLVLDNGIVDFSCGSITVDEYWGSAYDYSPYTKLLIWLPYCGYKDLNPDEVMGHTIDVRYRVDCATGACVAFVSTGVVGETGPQIPRVLAQMTGNMATPVPTTGVNYDNAVRNAISLVATGATIAAGAAIAPAAAAGAMAASGLVNATTSAVISSKPNVTRNGTIGASTGYMGVQVPYLIRVIPRLSLPSNYNNLKGYPSNMGGTLSGFTGYNEIADIKLEGLACTDSEYEEIERLVKEGIYV